MMCVALSYALLCPSNFEGIADELIQSYIQVQDKDNIKKKVCAEVSDFFSINHLKRNSEIAPHDFYTVMKQSLWITELWKSANWLWSLYGVWTDGNCRFRDHMDLFFICYELISKF
jgi:hypothetical protein